MGLLKKVFGGIFAFIGGLFGSLAKLFGFGDKKSGFYMELDENNKATPSAPTESVAADDAQKKKANSAQKVESSEVQKASSASKEKGNSLPPELKEISPTLNPDRPLVLPRSQAELQAEAAQGITNFATDFLVNPELGQSPRRRPGPSVSPFKDMARQMGKKSPSIG